MRSLLVQANWRTRTQIMPILQKLQMGNRQNRSAASTPERTQNQMKRYLFAIAVAVIAAELVALIKRNRI